MGTIFRNNKQYGGGNGGGGSQGASSADAVSYNNTSTDLTSNNVQDAISELDQNKANKTDIPSVPSQYAPIDAEKNVIVGVKANGTDLEVDGDRKVNVKVPTESDISNMGFTKNVGTYSKPTNGIPESDLAQSVKDSLSKADTALQSFTESDPTVPSWAKQPNPPTYSATDVGALPDTTTHLSGDIATSEKGAANGVATLGSDGKVPSSQLPSYVDDVLEYNGKSKFPTTGESGKIYVDTSDNKTYRWSGSSYVEISPSVVIGTTTGTAFDGKSGKDHVDNTTVHITSAERTKWNGKQDALTSQTAYTSKGSATKVPQITTNSLGQVTGITEVTITQPTVPSIANNLTTTTTGKTLDATQGKALNDKIDNKIDKTRDGVNEAINLLPSGATTPSDDDYYISQYANGGTTTTTYYRRPIKALWEYIKSKINSEGYAKKTEITEECKNYLPVAGGALTGALKYVGSANHAAYLNIKSNFEKGTKPSSTVYWNFNNTDKVSETSHATKNRVGLFETYVDANGNVGTRISAYKNEKDSTASSMLTAVYAADGTTYATAPTPSNANDNSTKIATTAWVNTHESSQLANYLPLSGGTITNAITPNADNSINFGDTTNAFKDIYASKIHAQAGGIEYGRIGVQTIGTTSTVGEGRLVLGNSKASGTDKNAKGQLFIYGESTGTTAIIAPNKTTGNTVTLPSTTGTLALTTDVTNECSKYLPLDSADGGKPTIVANADLNTSTYLELGTYSTTSANAATLKNCPTKMGFRMDVTTYYNGTKKVTTDTYVYRFRKITDVGGNQWFQQAQSGATANKFTYGTWDKISTNKDLLNYLPLTGGTMSGTVLAERKENTHVALGSSTNPFTFLAIGSSPANASGDFKKASAVFYDTNQIDRMYFVIDKEATDTEAGVSRIRIGAGEVNGKKSNQGKLQLNTSDNKSTTLMASDGMSTSPTVYLPKSAGTLALDTLASSSLNGLMSKEDKAILDKTGKIQVVTTKSTDLNDYKEFGVYYFSSTYTPANIPAGSNGWLIVLPISANTGTTVKQIWLRHGTATTNDWNTFVRLIAGSTVGEWKRFAMIDEVQNTLKWTSLGSVTKNTDGTFTSNKNLVIPKNSVSSYKEFKVFVVADIDGYTYPIPLQTQDYSFDMMKLCINGNRCSAYLMATAIQPKSTLTTFTLPILFEETSANYTFTPNNDDILINFGDGTNVPRSDWKYTMYVYAR